MSLTAAAIHGQDDNKDRDKDTSAQRRVDELAAARVDGFPSAADDTMSQEHLWGWESGTQEGGS